MRNLVIEHLPRGKHFDRNGRPLMNWFGAQKRFHERLKELEVDYLLLRTLGWKNGRYYARFACYKGKESMTRKMLE